MRCSRADVCLGFDTAQVVSPSAAEYLYRAGYRFVGRYLRRGYRVDDTPAEAEVPPGIFALSRAELKILLAARLCVLPIQFAKIGLHGGAEAGRAAGGAMASNAQSIGIPSGVHLWCDAEAFSSRATADHVATYVAAWADAVVVAGYRAGVYVGAGCGDPSVASDHWYSLPRITSYWRSCSWVPNVQTRGYAIKQGGETRLPEIGLTIDPDVIGYDAIGDRPYWCSP